MTTLFRGGSILTCDAVHTTAEALAIRRGKVLAVGDLQAVRAAAGADRREVDLAGATVMPGLIDTHPHLMHFGLFSEFCADLSDAPDHATIVSRLTERAAATRRGRWVLGSPIGEPHYFIGHSWKTLEEGVLPDRHVLDRVSDKHPVMILAHAPVTPAHVSMNSMALRRLGITPDTPDRVGKVWIEKGRYGRPTGRLSGSVNSYYNDEPFWDERLAKVLVPEAKKALLATLKEVKAYHALGVTTIYEGHAMDLDQIAGYKLLHRLGLLSMRVLCAPEAEPYGLIWSHPLSDDEFERRLGKAKSMVSRSSEKFRIDGITIGRGGPCGPGFLRMREAYKGPYGESTTGKSFVSKERAERAMDFCGEHGIRLNIVTAGNREHDEYLEYLEGMDPNSLSADGRAWILQHLYFVEEQQARRISRLGLDVTTSMSFSWGKGDMFRKRIGERCLQDLIPLNRLLSHGLHVGCGSDWGPKNIFKHIALAVEPTFAESGDKNLGLALEITREQSLSTWTREAAHVLRWEDVGSLEPGHHADLIVVDRNPLTAPLQALPETVVHATLVGGRCVHGETFLRERGWQPETLAHRLRLRRRRSNQGKDL